MTTVESDRPAFKHVPPFPSLIIHPPDYYGNGGNMLGKGNNFIIGVHRAVALKFPPTYLFFDDFDEIMGKKKLLSLDSDGKLLEPKAPDNPAEYAKTQRRLRVRHEESTKQLLLHETEMLGLVAQSLQSHPCQHIIQLTLCVSEGIFLPRLRSSLEDRINFEQRQFLLFGHPSDVRQREIPIHRKLRWTKQLAQALAWLEQAGLFHGDLRPANILLDTFDNVVVTDFGSSDKIGMPLITGAEVFCPFDWQVGTWRSEVWAYGWCIYNLFHGSVPEQFDIVPAEQVKFPSLDHLPQENGLIIKESWYGDHKSLLTLENVVLARYKTIQPWRYRMLDWYHETAAYVLSLFTRKYYLWLMRTLYENLRSAPPPPSDAEFENRCARKLQIIYRW